MIIGVPKEIKTKEFRVGIVPSGVEELTRDGHTIVIEKGAGLGSGITDAEYVSAGAKILDTADEVWAQADILMKVKEPLPPEYPRMKDGQVVYTYFHLAAVPELGDVLLEKKIKSVAYETIQLDNGSLPLLTPMSQVAGKIATQAGATFLQKEKGGLGLLLGGVPGTRHAHVVIIGAGHVGLHSAKVAYGMGAKVTILDISHKRLSEIDDIFSGKVQTLNSDMRTIRETAAQADLLIGAVLIPGAKAPHLVTRETLRGMRDGSVFCDVAIDQGGCAETSRPTSHDEPVFTEEGVIHYCVANIPGCVPMTSTYALTMTTFPYVRKMANAGLEDLPALLKQDHPLYLGINTWDGHITYEAVAEAFSKPYKPLTDLI